MKKPKILYVDDEFINLKLFEANFENMYNVLTAQDGFKALDIISNNNDINVVFSDMKMPNMNGLEFIKKARKLLQQINYYILTGFDITDEIQEALDNGLIQKYFSKPFKIDELMYEIESAIKNGDI
ncbi:MAG: response regulator [Bacteroidetes bacterium]|nr:response regulator [Bacteroidota bacterium]